MRHISDIEIQKYLDRRLSQQEGIFLEKHLPSCHFCQHRISEYQEIFEILNQPPEIDLPADFTEKVLAQIPKQQGHKWYENYLDQVLLTFALIAGMVVFFYFVGITILLRSWEYVSPAIQNSFNYLVKYMENNPNHMMITKYFMVALFIIVSIKLFDSFLIFRKRNISTS